MYLTLFLFQPIFPYWHENKLNINYIFHPPLLEHLHRTSSDLWHEHLGSFILFNYYLKRMILHLFWANFQKSNTKIPVRRTQSVLKRFHGCFWSAFCSARSSAALRLARSEAELCDWLQRAETLKGGEQPRRLIQSVWLGRRRKAIPAGHTVDVRQHLRTNREVFIFVTQHLEGGRLFRRECKIELFTLSTVTGGGVLVYLCSLFIDWLLYLFLQDLIFTDERKGDGEFFLYFIHSIYRHSHLCYALKYVQSSLFIIELCNMWRSDLLVLHNSRWPFRCFHSVNSSKVLFFSVWTADSCATHRCV